MGQLLTSSKKCIHWNEFTPTFSHGMRDSSISNQNPDDFGFLYFLKTTNMGTTKTLKGTTLYEFDKFSGQYGSTLEYLCDNCGAKYFFWSTDTTSGNNETYKDYGSYEVFDAEKLIHNDNIGTIDLSPTTTIYNNRGNWSYGQYWGGTYGGGIMLTYTPSVYKHDNIYVYLTSGPMNTNYFTLYDMTDPDVLSDSTALYNNILHAYDMGDCYNYISDGGFVDIAVVFNKIGQHSTSGEYSIFYGFDTWIYIYSTTSNFRNKTASVKMYNNDYPTTPYEKTYTFDHFDDYIGYNVIGFPIFTNYIYNGPQIVNYYDITIS